MKFSAIISWVVVIVIVLGIAWLNHNPARFDKLKEHARETAGDWQYEYLGKYSFGAGRAMKQQSGQMVMQMKSQADDSEKQIVVAIIDAELEGKESAINMLKHIDDPQAESVIAFYNNETDQLVMKSFARHYPWFYELAGVYGKSDTDPTRARLLSNADWMLRGTFIFFIGMVLVGAIGFMLLVLAIILLATGMLKFKTPRLTSRGEVYIESFALYLTLFVSISVLVSLLPDGLSMGVKMIPIGLGVVFAASWPMLRGVDFQTYRKTVGLHAGRNIFLEILCGAAGYVAGLPLVAIGMFVTYFLMKISHAQSTHPLAFELNEMSALMLYGLAAVFAPLTEELMFRGILVSHLRSWSGVLVSSLLSGLIFAAIHPQGWVAIPVLGTMGANFALIRQWRDSLIPSMVAHAINNGAVVTLLLLVTR